MSKNYEFKVIIPEETLEKFTNFEGALNSQNPAMAMMDFMMMVALKSRLEKKKVIALDADKIFNAKDEKEIDLLIHSLSTLGVIGMAQEKREEEQKKTEDIKAQNNVGSSTSYFGGATPKIGEDSYNFSL